MTEPAPHPSESSGTFAIEAGPDRAAWRRADGHALAAASLLDDPAVPEWAAGVHLRQGWAAMLAAGAGGDEPQDVLEALRGTEPRWVDAPARIADTLARLPDDDRGDLATLRELSVALSTAVGRARDEHFDPTHRHLARRRWLRRLGMAALVLIPIAIGLAITVPDYREGPWLGRYYDNRELSGEPALVRRDGDVKFDWKRMGPNSDLPDDDFSIRWDVCMVLDEDLEVAFQLISDDGSRLFVDGEQVVDNWGRHGERSRGADVPLSAGVHHLRVEYFDQRHAATIELRASLYGEMPDSVPVRILRYPGEEIDEEDPCAAVREAEGG